MLAYQRSFIEFALQRNALSFGDFILKSGRHSPYFFNAGQFRTGLALARLGEYYAAALSASSIRYDMLFGPAYKGIPLVSALSIALANDLNIDAPFAYNRKEKKAHGEGGTLVGAPLAGQILIVDDVITAGTAVREVIELIKEHGAVPAGVLIALDRQEKGKQELSAIQEITAEHGIPVIPIVTLDQILEYVQHEADYVRHFPSIRKYRENYGISSDTAIPSGRA